MSHNQINRYCYGYGSRERIKDCPKCKGAMTRQRENEGRVITWEWHCLNCSKTISDEKMRELVREINNGRTEGGLV